MGETYHLRTVTCSRCSVETSLPWRRKGKAYCEDCMNEIRKEEGTFPAGAFIMTPCEEEGDA